MWKRLILSLLVGIVLGLELAEATHIKAADLYATINPNNVFSANAHRIVRFTLTTYARRSTIDASGSLAECGQRLGNCVSLDFGDGTKQEAHYSSQVVLNNDTYQFIYYFDHTYPSDRSYTVSYYDENRNADIRNLKAPSDQLPFYVEMSLLIDAALLANQTPQPSIPPIDRATVGRTFTHNLGAYDINGDSISYEAATPLTFTNTFAPEYKTPDQVDPGTTQAGVSPAFYTVHPIRGDMKWDAPVTQGLYNVAVKVYEWRKLNAVWQIISRSTRDMQIEVKTSNNQQPVFSVIKDTIIEAGSIYKKNIVVNDSDNPYVFLELFGALRSNVNASFFPNPDVMPSGSVKTLQWVTTCMDVRHAPYQVVLKASDVVSGNLTTLSNVQSYLIHVKPLAIKGVKSELAGDTVVLSWNQYGCSLPNAKLKVYRQSGTCTQTPTTTVPASAELIGETSMMHTVFRDRPGAGSTNSYWLVAEAIDEWGQAIVSIPTYYCTGVPLGFKEEVLATSITAFPNPFQSVLSFKATSGGVTKVELFDTYSNKRMEEVRTLQTGDLFDLDVEALPAGLYTYRLTNSSNVRSGKVVKR